MGTITQFHCDDSSLFAEVASILGVELNWSQSREKWHSTYCLHTAEGRLPVMRARLSCYWRPFPSQIQCRAFRGAIETEWAGQKPSFLGVVIHGLLSVFGVPYPYDCFQSLRSEDGNRIMALHRVLQCDSPENSRAEINVSDAIYRLRMERVSPRFKILPGGYKIIAFDGNGDLVTAMVNSTRCECGTITIHRAVEGVEAVLAFVFLTACEMEMTSAD